MFKIKQNQKYDFIDNYHNTIFNYFTAIRR